MLRRALGLAVAAALLAPAPAAAQGTFFVNGTTLVYAGVDGVDQIAGFDTGLSIRFTRFGGAALDGNLPCVITDDGQSADCPKSAFNTVLLDLRGGDDVASVSSNVTRTVVFDGGAGNDGLFGGGGLDIFAGGPGNDNVIARDDRGEQVDCGADLDTAISDDADTRVSCEEVEGDADGDGVRVPRDCDDTKPGIRPGVVDIPDDDIDQDCSNGDAKNLDRDGDGSQRPQDCDDDNPRVRPGRREVRGNALDENCDTEVVPFPPIPGSVTSAWVSAGSGTRNRLLMAKGFPRRTRVALRCSGGCSSRSATRRVRGRRRAVNLHRFVGDGALRPGTRVELRFTLRRHVGRVLRFRIGSAAGSPDVDFLCVRPGGRARGC